MLFGSYESCIEGLALNYKHSTRIVDLYFMRGSAQAGSFRLICMRSVL